MSKKRNGLTRREFMELSAAGAAFITLGDWMPALAATPKRGGTLTCGMQNLANMPDPHVYSGGWARMTSALCWEGLTKPVSIAARARITKEKGADAVPEVLPMLAESWDIEKGGTRYVFHLRKGIKFHNGKVFGSDDVEWSWKRVLDPKIGSRNRQFLGEEYITSIDTPDAHTIVANLSQPYGAFLIANTWTNVPILPKDCAPKSTQWKGSANWTPPAPAPPGTGPFKIASWQQRLEAVFERFEGYYEKGLPYLDKIVYKVIRKPNPRTMAFRAGNVDYISFPDLRWLEGVMKGQKAFKPFYLEKEKVHVYALTLDLTDTIALNCHEKKDTPFKDVRVRKALELSIDRKVLAKTVFGDLAVPKVQAFNPATSIWGFDDIEIPKQDIAKAKALLKEAGYPNGLDVEFMSNPGYPGRTDMVAQVLQQMVGPAGFRLTIKPLGGAQYHQARRKYNYQMQVIGFGKDDPISHYYTRFHTDPSARGGYSYDHGVKNPELNKMLEAVATEADVKKRRELFKKVVLYVQEQAYIIPYLEPIRANAWSDRLKNYRPWEYGFTGERGFREAWLDA